MRLQLFLTIMLLCITACDIFDIPEPDANLRKRVIFPASTAEEQNLAYYFGDTLADNYWTPSESAVDDMNIALIQHLQAVGETEILENYDTYKHQYFGYAIGDKQYVYGNSFCDAFDFEWRTSFLMVSDGGNCFFQATFDVSMDEIIKLSINGEA